MDIVHFIRFLEPVSLLLSTRVFLPLHVEARSREYKASLASKLSIDLCIIQPMPKKYLHIGTPCRVASDDLHWTRRACLS